TVVTKAEKEAARERQDAIAKRRGKVTRKATIERLVVAKSGDLAYEFSRFRMDWAGGEGEPGGFDGVYLRVWRKVDGGGWGEGGWSARPPGRPGGEPGGPPHGGGGPGPIRPAASIGVYPIWHLPRAADTAVFAESERVAQRETLFGTGAGRLTPVFCSD